MADGTQTAAPHSFGGSGTTGRNGSAFFTGLLGALAGLMFGLDIGVISGAQSLIQKQFTATDGQIEFIVSAMMAGAAIGAWAAGWLSFSLGRKKSLVLSAILFVVGSLFCAFAWSIPSLIVARFILGLAIGVATFAAPLYLSEIAAESVRGAMISLYQLMITIGILVAFLSDLAFSHMQSPEAWRWMLGIVSVPGALFLCGILFVPNSPRWLMLRGRESEARSVLMTLRQDAREVDREINEIAEQIRVPQKGLAMFLANKNFRRAVALGIVLQIVQQFTGMNVMMYYAPKVFGLAGFGADASLWATASVGLTNVLATFISIALVDRLGRRPLLITSFVIMAIGLGTVGLLIGTGGTPTYTTQIITVVMLLVFIVGFAMAAGPVIWILCSEIQPLQGRDFGIAASTLTNWVANFIVGATFLSLLNGIGASHTFWLYAAFNVLFIFFTLAFVPETKHVSLEHIEGRLLSGEKLRNIGA